MFKKINLIICFYFNHIININMNKIITNYKKFVRSVNYGCINNINGCKKKEFKEKKYGVKQIGSID